MKHIFIINPTAGKRNQTSRMLSMAEQLRRQHGLNCSCMLTERPGGATEVARKAAETGEEIRVYSCGGDGTAGEVANGLAGFGNAAMTCIPIGTGNDFLKNFGDDLDKFSEAENLWNGPQFPLDLIDCSGRCALTIACAGIDARVAEDVHKFSHAPLLNGKGSYIAALAVNFLFKGTAQRWAVTVDGLTTIGKYSLVSVCNGRYYGGGFMPIPQARMDDGILDTIIVQGIGPLQFTRFVGPYAVGDWQQFSHLARVVRAQEVRIQSETVDIVVCLDGETFRSRDVSFRLSDKKVNFFGPAGCDCNRTARL